jgi:hypothetical protein
MTLRAIYIWMLPVLLVLTGPKIGQAADVSWPDAVAQLAGWRAKAETCVAALKRYGNEAQISHDQVMYINAKAHSDAVIAGLITALTAGETPASLSSLKAELDRGASGLADFCKAVNDLLPSTSGEKGVIADILKAAIEAVVKPLSDAVAALYNNHRKDKELILQTIRTQLEAAKWPDFAAVKAQ